VTRCWRAGRAGLALALAAIVLPASAQDDAAASCEPPAELARFELPLPATEAAFKRDGTFFAVAIGSSSTAGYGASSPAFSYPARLAEELKQRWPAAEIKVVKKASAAKRPIRRWRASKRTSSRSSRSSCCGNSAAIRC
jgi:hypothetical protein